MGWGAQFLGNKQLRKQNQAKNIQKIIRDQPMLKYKARKREDSESQEPIVSRIEGPTVKQRCGDRMAQQFGEIVECRFS